MGADAGRAIVLSRYRGAGLWKYVSRHSDNDGSRAAKLRLFHVITSTPVPLMRSAFKSASALFASARS